MSRNHSCARLVTCAVSLALALTVADAQTTEPEGQTAEVSTRDIPLTFRTKVNLVSVPVVVRDGQGRAVGNLSREDFQIYDGGKQQTVSRFAVERFGDAASAPPPAEATATPATTTTEPAPSGLAPPQRYVAYVFDDVNISAGELAQARDAAYQQMTSSLRPHGARGCLYDVRPWRSGFHR